MVQQPEALQAAQLAKESYATTLEHYSAAIATPDAVRFLPPDGTEVGPFYFKVALPDGGRNEPHFGVIRASRKRLRIGNKGTADATCWIYNVDVRAVSLTEVRGPPGGFPSQFMDALKKAALKKKINPEKVTLHRGFLNLVLSSLEDLWPTVKAWLEETAAETDRSVDISGHSLGGAASSILALAIAGLDPNINVRCITFGSPKVFQSTEAVALFTQSVSAVARFVAQMAESLVTDLVSLVPPAFNHPVPERTLCVSPTPALQQAIDARKAVPWAAIGAGVLELHSMEGYLGMVERLTETEIQTSGMSRDAVVYRLAGYALNATMNLFQMKKTEADFALVVGVLQNAETIGDALQKLNDQGATTREMPYLADLFSKLESGNISLPELASLATIQRENWRKNCSLQAGIRVANSIFQEARTVMNLYNEIEASKELFDVAKASFAEQKVTLQRIRNELPGLVVLVDKIALLDQTATEDKARMTQTFEERTLAILDELRGVEVVLDSIVAQADIQSDLLDDVIFKSLVIGFKSVFDAGFSTYIASQGKNYNMAWTGLAATAGTVAASATFVGTDAKILQAKWRQLRREVGVAHAEVEQVRRELQSQHSRMHILTDSPPR